MVKPTSHIMSNTSVMSNNCASSPPPLELSGSFSANTSPDCPSLPSPVRLSRDSARNVKCYQRRSRKSIFPTPDQSDAVPNLDISNSTSDSPKEFSPDLPLDLSLAGMAKHAMKQEKISLDRTTYESLKAELEDYRLKYKEQFAKTRKLRDNVTELEVDKMELQEKLKSCVETVNQMTSIINKMEEECKQKCSQRLEERIAEFKKNYEELHKKGKRDVEISRLEISDADAVTFRNVDIISANDEMVKFYTGLPSYVAFKLVLDLAVKRISDVKELEKSSLAPWQNLLMTLMRLRLGLLPQDLAYRFGVSHSTIRRNFNLWLDAYCHVRIENPSLLQWPDPEGVWDLISKEKIQVRIKP